MAANRNPSAFRASQVPLSAQGNVNTPYRRPLGTSGRTPAGNGSAGEVSTQSTRPSRSSGENQDPPPQETIFVQLMNEIRRVWEEQHKGRDELRKMSEQLGKLDDDFRQLADQVKSGPTPHSLLNPVYTR